MRISNKLELTRRQFFFGSAIGALTLLGTTHTKSGIVAAYADETGNVSFEIVILGREDIGIYSINPTNNQVIPNVNVRIESFASAAKEKLKETITNERGIAVVKGRNLGENCSDDEPIGGYHFFAKVEANKDGYRDFATDLIRLYTGPMPKNESGTRPANLTIPIQVNNQTGDFRYLRRLSFDEFDIQYNKASFVSCKGNNIEHTLLLEIVGTPGKSISAEFSNNGKTLGTATGVINSSGKGVLEIKGKFLESAETEKELKINFNVGEGKYEASHQLHFIEPAAGMQDGIVNENGKLSPGIDGASIVPDSASANTASVNVSVPEGFPIGTGSFMPINLPFFPVMVKVNPLGMAAIGFGITLEKTIPGKTGEGDDNSWKNLTSETWKEFKERRIQEMFDAYDKYEDVKAIKDGTKADFGQAFFGGLTLRFEASLLLEARWGKRSGYWDAGLNLCALFNLMYEWGFLFMAGPIPAYLGHDIKFNNSLSLYLGAEIEGLFKGFDWSTDFGLTIVNRFEIGASLGVGIRGFISGAVRGYAYAQATTGFVKTDKAFPHFKAEGGAGFQLVIQVLFFSISLGLYNVKCKPWYDNWGDSNNLEDGKDMPTIQAYESNGDILYLNGDTAINLDEVELKPLDTRSLLQRAEFTAAAATKKNSLGNEDIDFRYVYTGKKATNASVNKTGIISLNNLESKDNYDATFGIYPALDAKIYTDVYSDSRHKCIKTLDGSLFLAKLSIVQVNDWVDTIGTSSVNFDSDKGVFANSDKGFLKAHTLNTARCRVTISKMGSDGAWSDPQIVDFDFKDSDKRTMRANFDDCDFDFCEDESRKGHFYFNICSVLKQSDNEDLKTRWCNQRVTFVDYDFNRKKVVNSLTETGPKVEADKITCYTPRVLYYSVGQNRKAVYNWTCAIVREDKVEYRLYSRVYKKDYSSVWIDKYFNPYYDTKTAPLYCSFEAEKGPNWFSTTKNPSVSWVGQRIGTSGLVKGDYSIFQIFLPFISQSANMLEHAFSEINKPTQVPGKGWIMSLADDDMKDPTNDIRKGKRQSLEFKYPNDNGVISSKNVGDANMTSYTSSNDGSRLYALRVEDGSVPSALANDLNPGVESKVVGVSESGETHKELYTIFAANWDENKQSYVKFYPFAQIDHPIDLMESVALGNGHATFVGTEITELKAGRGDIYQINVPLVCSLRLMSANTMDIFCGVGDTCHVYFNVLNNGNVPIKRFRVRVYDNEKATGEPLVTKVLTTGSDVLWPGDQQTFGSADFNIPEAWRDKGEMLLYAFADEPVPADDSLASVKSQSSPTIGDEQERDDTPVSFEATGDVKPNSDGVFYDALTKPIGFSVKPKTEEKTTVQEIYEPTYTPLNEEAKKQMSYKTDFNSNNKSDSNSSNASATQGGEALGSLAGILGVAAVGAGAFAAYSKRRSDNEKANEEQRDKD